MNLENRIWLGTAAVMVAGSVFIAGLGRLSLASAPGAGSDESLRTVTPLSPGPGSAPLGMPPLGGHPMSGTPPLGGPALRGPPSLGSAEPTDAALDEAFDSMAKATGSGRVQCELPPNTGAVLESALYQNRKSSTLRALVEGAVGSTPLRDPSGKALAVATWTDAWPGQLGSCVLEEVRILEHHARFATPPAEPKLIGDCLDQTLDEEGVTIRAIAGAPCTVRVIAGGRTAVLEVLEEDPRNDLELSFDGSPATAAELRGQVADKVRASDPIEAALNNPDTTPPARAVLEAWKRSGDPP